MIFCPCADQNYNTDTVISPELDNTLPPAWWGWMQVTAGLYKSTVLDFVYLMTLGRPTPSHLHVAPRNKHTEIPHCAWRRNDARLLRPAALLRQEPGADGRREKSSTKSITSWLEMIAPSPQTPTYVFKCVHCIHTVFPAIVLPPFSQDKTNCENISSLFVFFRGQ